MIIVGEKINSSIKSVYTAIENNDVDFLLNLITAQEKSGADYIDVNTGAFLGDEYEKLCWLFDNVLNKTSLPLMIDTPNDEIALKICQKYTFEKKPIINSVTLEKKRFDNMLEAVKICGGSVVALCMENDTENDCVKIADILANKLVKSGIKENDIYIDPMISPLSADSGSALSAIDNIHKIREALPDVHIICGLSNVSYGLPKRSLINRTFIVNAMKAGLDSAIINPLDRDLVASIYAENLILGNDEYCMQYINATREKII